MYYNFIIYLHNQFFLIREFVGLMHLQSVPNYCFRHILMILKKINIPVNYVHLNSMKGKKFKISSLTWRHLLLYGKTHRNKK